MIRRYGEAVVSKQRYVHRAGAYAVLPRNGKLLVTLQTHPRVEVQLPGGGIDPGESTVRALHREVFEETGWHIAAPRRLGAFRRFVYMPEYDMWAEKLCHIYMARPVRPHGPPSEDGHTAMWLSPSEAYHELGNAGDADFVARLFGLIPPRLP